MASERLLMTEQRLKAYYDAEITVLAGQSYSIGTRSLTRADLTEIRVAISELQNQVDELKNLEASGGRRKAFRITPRDL